MRQTIGCAGIIATVAFLIAIIGSLFATEADLGQRLLIALVTAAMAFVAAVILISRDRKRRTAVVQSVRQMLLDREDVSDTDFATHFPNHDPILIAQTRQAIADFFDVPTSKIHPTDDLRRDLKFDLLEPGFHTAVVYRVFAARNVEPRPFVFRTSNLADVGDLAKEICRVIDGFQGESSPGS